MKIEPLGIQHAKEAVHLRQRSQPDHGVGHTLTVEALQVSGDAPQRDGNLRYHIRPIREAMEWYTQHQLYLAEAAAERHRVQRKLSAQAAEPPCSPQ